MPGRVAPALLCAVLLSGCSVAPSPSPSPPGPAVSPGASIAPSDSRPSSSPAGASTASIPPLPPSATIPVARGPNTFGELAWMAPAPGGSLWVRIPASDGVVVVRLDTSGRPAAGWPILLPGASQCGLLLPVDDGSVRVVCQFAREQVIEGPPPERAYAFDAAGRLLAGWPVDVPCCFTGRVIGDELTLYVEQVFGTDSVPGEPIPGNAWILKIAADGTVRSGEQIPLGEHCCSNAWAIGPDGVAYGVSTLGPWQDGEPETSQIGALDLSGTPTGWPVTFDGIASGPAFGRDGRILVTVGSFVNPTSGVLAFEPRGTAISASSAVLPIQTAEAGVDCVAGSPRPPIVGGDGTTFVFSELDGRIFALNPALAGIAGWPIEPAPPLVREPPPPDAELFCSPPGVPAAGPGGTLYLPLLARDETTGGGLAAMGLNGRVVTGWPVELQRRGAYFWTIAVGLDGTVYALAVEPEPGGGSSASVLAFAPDSTVLYTSTIVEP